ncbi:MAG: lytic transglycosylase domain-containing protein [Vicinamibacterales bacterium]
MLCTLLCLLTPLLSPVPVSPPGLPQVVQAQADPGVGDQTGHIDLSDLVSVRLQATVLLGRASGREDARVAALTDLGRLVQAVAGTPEAPAFTTAELRRGLRARGTLRFAATPGTAARDADAYRLLALGYSTRETADVVTGRIGLAALDRARGMLAAGGSRETAADYLDGEYRRLAAARTPRVFPPVTSRPLAPRGRATSGAASSGSAPFGTVPSGPTPFDAAIREAARRHRVEEALVRAVITAESAFRPAAVSPAGAIGLMQLMPGTARELGVNPWVPSQNIEGGVRYLASLIEAFGGVELGLVAYNGGPDYARRYARGDAVLYGETRDYVRKVLRLLASAP